MGPGNRERPPSRPIDVRSPALATGPRPSPRPAILAISPRQLATRASATYPVPPSFP